MSDFTLYILTTFALVFVFEGLLYTLFPDAMRKLMAQAMQMPVEQLRMFGLVMAVSGFCLVWFLQSF